jgi:hypothetical protein
MFHISTGKLVSKFRIAAFKKVTGPEIQELDRSLFRKRSYFKIFRKKRFRMKKKDKKRDGDKKEHSKEHKNGERQ